MEGEQKYPHGDGLLAEAVLLIHWTGGWHTEVRVARVKTGRYPAELAPSAVEALRKLGGHWPDRELACPSIGCFARLVMARAGRPCVFAKCASAWEFPNMMPPKWTYRWLVS